MGTDIARSIAEAQAQRLILPAFEDWRKFAGLMDGYKIAEELGLDRIGWMEEQRQQWQSTGQWNLDVLHLRLMLFFIFRADYHSGYTYTEHDDIAASLLQALHEQLSIGDQDGKE